MSSVCAHDLLMYWYIEILTFDIVHQYFADVLFFGIFQIFTVLYSLSAINFPCFIRIHVTFQSVLFLDISLILIHISTVSCLTNEETEDEAGKASDNEENKG